MKRFVQLATAAAFAAISALATAQTTLTFDNLPLEPGAAGTSFLEAATGGTRTVDGVVFNSSTNSDWEIYGNQFKASGEDNFANSSSGTYALAGNAFSGLDLFGNSYDGLTISTSLVLTSIHVGFGNNGGGAHDAQSLKITAFGVRGDLGSTSFTLSSNTLSLIDTTRSFSRLTGIIGYRFETTAADALNAAFGRAYFVADDLHFAAGSTPSVPEPSTVLTLVAGLAFLRRSTARR